MLTWQVIILLAMVYAFEAPFRGMAFGIPSHRGLAKAGVFLLKKCVNSPPCQPMRLHPASPSANPLT